MSSRYRTAGDVMWRVRVAWEPRDTWLGLYWERWSEPFVNGRFRSRRWFICLVPCLPIIVTKRETLRDF